MNMFEQFSKFGKNQTFIQIMTTNESCVFQCDQQQNIKFQHSSRDWIKPLMLNSKIMIMNTY
jgi:hypothetical protein